ncbi:bifunctional folylpolyglutamate synthase/dihydrofolate synthase [Magnetofaba australis]|uniref:Dihydrofolate synthase/folylpolyglutamate synthase n=1 Tax=Magnetofaba australis IT-1 TaxID=1434232 RepID=A0A1Y2K6G4_9PROT|nr:cyanophycin synthetase [Magnetofaba australis]OSM05264.1 putative bifunctional folylpolyglutamate synthase/dihydrofolate synthase [Magnetofaba australis IT-1]
MEPSGSERLIRPGLERVVALLDALGGPQRSLRHVVHVAGTNGKGSVLAFLEAILKAAGIPSGVYTSPHLHRFNERIRVAGAPIDDAALDRYLAAVRRADPNELATYFEQATAAALLHFADWAALRPGGAPAPVLLETGLGGRLDATNVFPAPLLTAITPIALDHADYLGQTIEAVAAEKAGILKAGVTAVVHPGSLAARNVIAAQAEAAGAPLWLAQRDYRYDMAFEAHSWRYEDAFGQLVLPRPGLVGQHQMHNAAQAVAMARLLRANQGWRLPNEAVCEAVAQAQWPGRLQRIATEPEVWLDGAHNAHAAQAAAAFFAETPGRKPTLLFAVMSDKDLPSIIDAWRDGVEAVVCVGLDDARALDPHRCANTWRAAGVPAHEAPDIPAGLALARDLTGHGGRVAATGSLYLVGALLSAL